MQLNLKYKLYHIKSQVRTSSDHGSNLRTITCSFFSLIFLVEWVAVLWKPSDEEEKHVTCSRSNYLITSFSTWQHHRCIFRMVQRSSPNTTVSPCPVLIEKKKRSKNASHSRVHTACPHYGSIKIKTAGPQHSPCSQPQDIVTHKRRNSMPDSPHGFRRFLLTIK